MSQSGDHLKSGQLGIPSVTARRWRTSLPFLMWHRHRDSFSPLRHVAIPALGAITLIVPFAELCQPGQPVPYNTFPYLALALAAVAAVIGWLRVRRDPRAGAGEGAESWAT